MHQDSLGGNFSLGTQADRLEGSMFLGTKLINNPCCYWVNEEKYVTTYILAQGNMEVLEHLTLVEYTKIYSNTCRSYLLKS